MPVRVIVLLVLALAGTSDPPIQYPPWFQEALQLGRTHDDALFEAFNKGYGLSPSGIIDSAEVLTEFRRAVLIVREHALQGDLTFGPPDLAKALTPYRDLVTFIVRVRLPPSNTLMGPPPYDLYVSTGPRTPPLAAKPLKREPVYPPGGAVGSPIVAVRLEASFPNGVIVSAPDPNLVVVDEKAGVLWQARIDLSRYR
jgi:hypothetical protein